MAKLKRERKQEEGHLALMTEEERQEMVRRQMDWDEAVANMRAKDDVLTQYRVYIRSRYDLPRNFVIDLASGVITEPQPEEAVAGEEEL